jgi:hypothetical protein
MQQLKQYGGIAWTSDGMQIDDSRKQPEKADFSIIDNSESGSNVICDRFGQE